MKGEDALRELLNRKDETGLKDAARLVGELLLLMAERFRQLNGEDYCYACEHEPAGGHAFDCPMVRLNEIHTE